jgi:beta-N-acetylhexosaminidase
MYREGRTWSFDAGVTARLSTAFAVGLQERGVVATMKHFPGLGLAKRDTDQNLVRIGASLSRLAPGLKPYRSAIPAGVKLIMLSNAVYKAWDPNNAAGWSRKINTRLLRGGLGYRGATITDSLDGAAASRGTTDDKLAIRAAKAGTDFILITGSGKTSRSVFRSLLAAAQAGTIPRSRLVGSYNRILALKAGL